MKSLVTAAVSTALLISASSGIAADYSKAEKELKIMSRIFETSLAENRESKRRFSSRSLKPKSTYLAKQGMVFRFSFGNYRFESVDGWQAFGEGIGQLVSGIGVEVAEALADVDISEPVAPVAPLGPDFENEWEEQVEAYEQMQEALEMSREAQRDDRRKVRELQRELRDLERQKRDESRNDKELTKTRQKLESKMQALSKKTKEYEKKMKEYREKKAAKYQAKVKGQSDLLLTTLCDYGATLRSLKNDEHVTLIYENYANGKDQVYVFNYADVKNCSSKDKLVKKSISYQL